MLWIHRLPGPHKTGGPMTTSHMRHFLVMFWKFGWGGVLSNVYCSYVPILPAFEQQALRFHFIPATLHRYSAGISNSDLPTFTVSLILKQNSIFGPTFEYRSKYGFLRKNSNMYFQQRTEIFLSRKFNLVIWKFFVRSFFGQKFCFAPVWVYILQVLFHHKWFEFCG